MSLNQKKKNHLNKKSNLKTKQEQDHTQWDH